MIKIALIGSGNLAQHLINVFCNNVVIELVGVYSRDKNSVSHLVNKNIITDNYDTLPVADVYIIVVSDTAIQEVSTKITAKNKLVVHTAGNISIDVLNDKNRKGVFYPLQSFTKNKAVNFKETPICIETKDANDSIILKKIAQSISNKVYEINSEQRKSLHISAVFVNNFVNHLYKIGCDICTEHGVDFEILKPLILETAQKINNLSPQEAQTGPAKRNDLMVIENQIQFLNNNNHKEIYKILTQSIQQYGKEL